MSILPDQLRTMADAIKTGRSVARTSVAALVYEAATRFETLQTYAKELEAENIKLKHLLSDAVKTWWDTPYLISKSELRIKIQNVIGADNE